MNNVNAGQWHDSVQALETAVFRSAGFREESGGQPLVYGYVRSASRQSRHLAACRRSLERYCQRERLQLCTVFTDTGTGKAKSRPCLAGLCDVLRLPDSFAVVMVGIGHLPPDGRVAEQLIRQIPRHGRTAAVGPSHCRCTESAVRTAAGVVPVMTAPRATDSGELIEQFRKVDKLLPLYVVALQEEMTLTADDHYRIARALRGITHVTEQKANEAPIGISGDSRPLIQGGLDNAHRADRSTTGT